MVLQESPNTAQANEPDNDPQTQASSEEIKVNVTSSGFTQVK